MWAKSMMHPFFSWCQWDSSYTIHIIIRLIVCGHSTLSIICKGYRFTRGMISKVLCAMSNLVLWQYFSELLLWCNSPGPKKQRMRHVDAGKELELATAFLCTIYLHKFLAALEGKFWLCHSKLRNVRPRDDIYTIKVPVVAIDLPCTESWWVSTQLKPMSSQMTNSKALVVQTWDLGMTL